MFTIRNKIRDNFDIRLETILTFTLLFKQTFVISFLKQVHISFLLPNFDLGKLNHVCLYVCIYALSMIKESFFTKNDSSRTVQKYA